MADDRRPTQRGDETELFLSYNDELLRDVKHVVSTSRQNIEDACAFAWTQFLIHQPDRNRNWRGWLFRVAQREAWMLHRGGRRELSATPHWAPSPVDAASDRDTWDAIREKGEVDEAVEVLRQLPPRLREVAFLRATGFRYDQIAEMTGNSMTTVSRLVRRANERIHDAITQAQRVQRPSEGRAGRLEELERDPPRWLLGAIGQPPGRRAPAAAALLLQWRRTALLIDDYRKAQGRHDPDDAIGTRPADADAARSYALVTAAIERVHQARHPCRERSHGH